MILGTWHRGRGLRQTPHSPREKKPAQEWRGLRVPPDPGCFPLPRGGRAGPSLVPGSRVILGGRRSPSAFSPGATINLLLLCPAVVQGFAWAGAWIGRGGVIEGNGPDRKPSLSRQPLQPLQPPPQPPPGLRWARNRVQGLGEGVRCPEGLGRGVATAPPLRPGQRRVYWLLPVCGAVGLGP